MRGLKHSHLFSLKDNQYLIKTYATQDKLYN